MQPSGRAAMGIELIRRTRPRLTGAPQPHSDLRIEGMLAAFRECAHMSCGGEHVTRSLRLNNCDTTETSRRAAKRG